MKLMIKWIVCSVIWLIISPIKLFCNLIWWMDMCYANIIMVLSSVKFVMHHIVCQFWELFFFIFQHFIPIQEDSPVRHYIREGSAFSCYSPWNVRDVDQHWTKIVLQLVLNSIKRHVPFNVLGCYLYNLPKRVWVFNNFV